MKERYWRATEFPMNSIYRCFTGKSFSGAEPGLNQNQTSYGDSLCRKGHKGPLCNVCRETTTFRLLISRAMSALGSQ